MKIKAWIIGLASLLALAASAQAGPAVQIFVGGNAGCNPAFVRPAPVVCRPGPLYPTVPIVYQSYGAAYPTPIYYGVGPTTITYTSGNSSSTTLVSPNAAFVPVTPLIVPPPVIINRPVTVHQGTPFSWKH